MGWAIRGVIPARARDLPLLQNVKTGHMAHKTSYSTGTRDTFPKGTMARI